MGVLAALCTRAVLREGAQVVFGVSLLMVMTAMFMYMYVVQDEAGDWAEDERNSIRWPSYTALAIDIPSVSV